MFIAAIIAAVFFVLYTFSVSQSGSGGGRGSRRAFEEADRLLMQAEGSMLRGQYDAAFSQYSRVPPLARQSGCILFEAEAYYGMARIHEKNGDLPSARQALESALSSRADWESEKPNFARLISNMLDDVNRRSPK
ncbi:MAG: hypothetical protein JSS86_06470 [Cyanobacteria bacterium SZAS LIN-2]|nr:hypothetical protein [Cyanobacteria bacterium SZAS LIN-3]MBS1995934.1 hypothetical protein [Cyanobacteria bacterium SZAS LIN-2]MBS2010626.1 hypothetical protein [Cyanobacteria bacterium SZAS TMP-1]